MPETAHSDGQPQNPSVHHEPSDANLRWLLILGAVALVAAVIIHAVVLWGFLDYRNYQAEVKESTFPLAAEQPDRPPPEPRLEQLDRQPPPSLRKKPGYTQHVKPSDGRQRPNDAKILNSYGAAPEKGYVRIPIDRAMKLLENKLPVRKGAAKGKQKGEGLAEGGQSNSGRPYRRNE